MKNLGENEEEKLENLEEIPLDEEENEDWALGLDEDPYALPEEDFMDDAEINFGFEGDNFENFDSDVVKWSGDEIMPVPPRPSENEK